MSFARQFVPSLSLCLLGLGCLAWRAAAQDVSFFPETTYKIVQLTGQTDKPRRIPTLSRMVSRYCVDGTDLGSTFEHDGRLYFLKIRAGNYNETLTFSKRMRVLADGGPVTIGSP